MRYFCWLHSAPLKLRSSHDRRMSSFGSRRMSNATNIDLATSSTQDGLVFPWGDPPRDRCCWIFWWDQSHENIDLRSCWYMAVSHKKIGKQNDGFFYRGTKPKGCRDFGVISMNHGSTDREYGRTPAPVVNIPLGFQRHFLTADFATFQSHRTVSLRFIGIPKRQLVQDGLSILPTA